jgi:hypothetical protein
MTTMERHVHAQLRAPAPGRLRGPLALAALAWNLYGIAQFAATLRPATGAAAELAMEASRASALAYPGWMTLAFAVGVFGGALGSALVLARRAAAVPVLGASLAAYCVLYVGDITEGVFAALGPSQVAVLTTVVAIAVALFRWSLRLRTRGELR